MGAILRDSIVVAVAAVVRTHPRGIPLAMITMRNLIHRFSLVSYMGMGLCLAPFGLLELRYEVSSEMFDPSFFLCKFSNKSTLRIHAKSVKSSVFRWRYLDCLWSKFLAKITVWKLILRTTFSERSYFPQRFQHGPKFVTYNQHILHLASRWYEPVDARGRAAVKFNSRKSHWIVVK